MVLKIDSSAAVKFTNTLEKMHRSALPNAIRSTLNSAAFDVKTNTMSASADKEFTNRAPNFFKANSRVEMAKGFKIDAMIAVVGFAPKGGPGADKAVKELEQQEYGGNIESRSFVPMDTARVSGNQTKVRPMNRIGRIRKVVNSNTMAGRSPSQQFNYAAAQAGAGGFVLGNTPSKTLWRIDSIDGRGNVRKKTPVYSFDKGRKVHVAATSFMRLASMESAGKMESIYAREAQKQIERLRSK